MSEQQLAQELTAITSKVVKTTLEWSKEHPERTFDDIEAFVLKVRRQIGQEMAAALCEEQEAARPVPGPKCPKCGREMHYKGEHRRTIGSLVSDVKIERSYYHCEHCKDKGIFPPG
jgi:hypothetical protein